MKKIVVLGGAGAMGQVIVRDLAETSGFDKVVIGDFNQQKANEVKAAVGSKKVETAFADVKDQDSLAALFRDATIVINSTPYYFNVEVMKAALQSSCHYIDLGGLFHVTRQQLELNDDFREKGLTAVLGMGAAPGMTNIMAACCVGELDEVESIDIIIGCVDFVKVDHPLQPPYALDTILDEYTKEPMVFEDGEFRAKPPMSGEIVAHFPAPVGDCRAILTLHSEVATLPITFQHKGVRHVTFRLGLPTEFHEKLKFLVDLGFGGSEELKGVPGPFVPRKVLTEMLARFPIPDEEPDDCEVVRVETKGIKNGKPCTVSLETTVFANKQWKVSCGALDTAVPPSIVANMILTGEILDRGTLPPEVCVPHAPFFHELAKRSIIMRKTLVETVSGQDKSNRTPTGAGQSRR
ncbi:MAG TPA: saccharopine dehydrogenase NADP-binding domain-containing protein [Candidatus Obscuribacterales bacterium]